VRHSRKGERSKGGRGWADRTISARRSCLGIGKKKGRPGTSPTGNRYRKGTPHSRGGGEIRNGTSIERATLRLLNGVNRSSGGGGGGGGGVGGGGGGGGVGGGGGGDYKDLCPNNSDLGRTSRGAAPLLALPGDGENPLEKKKISGRGVLDAVRGRLALSDHLLITAGRIGGGSIWKDDRRQVNKEGGAVTLAANLPRQAYLFERKIGKGEIRRIHYWLASRTREH